MTELAYHDEDQPSNVIDFTAYKLQVCIDIYRRQGNEQAEAFEQALYLYLKGELAIEWIEGNLRREDVRSSKYPNYIRLPRECQGKGWY